MAEVVGFGPSLVDISAKLDSAAFESCQEILDAEPGDWRSIDSDSTLQNLLRIIAPEILNLDARASDFNSRGDIVLVAGSTTLGMIAAMSPDTRSRATYVSTLAKRGTTMDPFSEFFKKSVAEMGITHEYKEIEGNNPIGLVLTSGGIVEKILGMYSGVANLLDSHTVDAHKADCVLIDAYELQNGPISVHLDSLIQDPESKVALSLGNHSILTGDLKNRIRDYIKNGRLYAICGNDEEFAQLYDELDAAIIEHENFEEHPVHNEVPYVLLTRGPAGISAQWNSDFFSVPAHPLPANRIVNTSGAGDTSMGVFCEGIITNSDPKETLKKAAYMATKVLSVPGSLVLASR